MLHGWPYPGLQGEGSLPQSLSRSYSSSSRKCAVKCTGVTRRGDCVVNWLLYAWCVVQVWLRHRHGARQEPIGWLRTSCLPTADCLPSSQVYDRWRIHCISCRHSPVKYHSVVYHVDLPRWLRWLRHSAHRPGRSDGGAGVQFPGRPVDFVFGFQGRMLWY